MLVLWMVGVVVTFLLALIAWDIAKLVAKLVVDPDDLEALGRLGPLPFQAFLMDPKRAREKYLGGPQTGAGPPL